MGPCIIMSPPSYKTYFKDWGGNQETIVYIWHMSGKQLCTYLWGKAICGKAPHSRECQAVLASEAKGSKLLWASPLKRNGWHWVMRFFWNGTTINILRSPEPSFPCQSITCIQASTLGEWWQRSDPHSSCGDADQQFRGQVRRDVPTCLDCAHKFWSGVATLYISWFYIIYNKNPFEQCLPHKKTWSITFGFSKKKPLGQSLG